MDRLAGLAVAGNSENVLTLSHPAPVVGLVREVADSCLQYWGGMGFTWEFDCHMYYRRANAVALGLGSLSYWEDALIDRMRKKNAA